MQHFSIIVLIFTLFLKFSRSEADDLSLPENIALGAATASYQIEGAWNVSGKGENVWDRFTHTHPEKIADRSNGDIACDSYHKYKEDVQWIKTIGLDFYRFSISWSRILPNGFANEINEEGIRYYKNFIQELIANDIEPVVTIYHWDHPQILEELGGWSNELMVEWYADYARIIFEELGPMVKTYITINEPQNLCALRYEDSTFSPVKSSGTIGKYLCVHNVLKAHATVYHIYDREFRSEQQGELGLTMPLTGWIWTDDTNATLVDQYFQFSSGWLMHPIYYGDYPEIMKTRIAMISELEGYPFSRLPEFSDEWIAYIKGTVDFYGLNHYTSCFISPDPDEELGIYNTDSGIIQSVNESWPVGSLSWLHDVPVGFGNLLRMIRDEYNNPSVYVMENGYCDYGELKDYARIHYYRGYMKELISAVKKDGCNIQKYTAWSLIDDFEWISGYTPKFGLVHVNFSDPERTRTAKLSTTWWQSVVKTRILQEMPVVGTDST